MIRQRVVGWVVLAAAIVALVVAAVTGIQQARYARCQAGVNEALIQVQTARADAAEQDRQSDRDESAATAELIRTVFTAESRQATIDAYAAYRVTLDEISAKRAEAEKQRTENPLPAPPSEICD